MHGGIEKGQKLQQFLSQNASEEDNQWISKACGMFFAFDGAQLAMVRYS